jgi:dTDP-4-amino-4,6-dideoxygalactose transaminase
MTAERRAAPVLSLLMFPELSDARVDRVVEALRLATEGGW